MKSAPFFALAAAAALALVSVAPAQAAPPALPAGDALYTITCDSTANPFQLFSVNAADGASTRIGSGLADNACSYDPAWDPTTGIAYALSDTGAMDLVRVDVATGAMTAVGPIAVSGSPIDEASLTIDLNGVAWLVEEDGPLYTVDLATGAATSVGDLAIPGLWAWGFATDPTTGDLYLLNWDGALYRIDPVAVTSTLVGNIPLPTGVNDLYGLTIDSAGTLWIISYPGGDGASQSGLWSTSLAAPGVLELSGVLFDTTASEDFYSFVIFSTWGATPPPAPALAATGFDATPFVGGAALLLLAGIVLLARQRRTA